MKNFGKMKKFWRKMVLGGVFVDFVTPCYALVRTRRYGAPKPTKKNI
jgi:hypothetical protein